MGAAVLITLGVLFLMQSYDVMPFDRSFPVLLLVIGCVLLVSRTGSTEGHIQPGWIQSSIAQPPAPQPWTAPAAPSPQPQPPADNPPSSSGQNDSQVKS
ncbi:MAG TPA: DUF5668 domain-containing protein [Candidatus Angelobacter sp.]|jgi:hypothetical protein